MIKDWKVYLNLKIFLRIFFVLMLTNIIIFIFYATKAFFHYDNCTVLLLAKEQIQTKQLFPKTFYGTTGIPLISLNLFIVPLMMVFDDWILCREIAVIIQMLLGILLIYYFYKKVCEKENNSGLIAIILLLVPISEPIYENYFFQATYLKTGLYILIFLLSLNYALKNENNKWAYVIVTMISAFVTMESFRHLLVIMLPIIGAYIIYNWIEKKKSIKIMIYILFGTLIGQLIYQYLRTICPIWPPTFKFAESEKISKNILGFIVNIIELYGASGGAEVLSLEGIMKPICWAYMFFSLFVSPIYLIINYKKCKNKFWKIYLIYLIVSDFLTIYTVIFSNQNNIRYIISIYFIHLILTAYVMGQMWNQIRQLRIKQASIVIFFCSILIVTAGTWCDILPQVNAYEKKEGFVKFLEEQNLTYGYSSWQNAWPTGISNGQIMINTFDEDPLNKSLAGTSSRYFNPDEYQGRCFILIKKDEDIKKIYYQQASEILYYNSYIILIYDNNIYGMPELLKEKDFYGYVEKGNIDLPELSVSSNGYKLDDEIGLKHNSYQFGAFYNLKAGTYEIKVTGQSLQYLMPYIMVKDNTEKIEIEILYRDENEVVYQFFLQNDIEGVELCTANYTEGETCMIQSMNIEKRISEGD